MCGKTEKKRSKFLVSLYPDKGTKIHFLFCNTQQVFWGLNKRLINQNSSNNLQGC